MLKLPETTDWSSSIEQQIWYDMFKSKDEDGIKFNQFQNFLKVAIYAYFARIGTSNEQKEQKDEIKFTYQQEMLLFKVFDLKNDHLIDRDEFASLCHNWLAKTYRRACALVIVDVQNDFIDGSLALINGPAGEDGAEVVPVINRILERCSFDAIAYTQDWHPQDHIGFHENLHLRKYTQKSDTSNLQVNGESKRGSDKQSKIVTSSTNNNNSRFKLKRLIPNAQLFDTVLFDDGKMEQKLWPTHCVQHSWGAELHPKLKIVSNAIRIHKGTLSNVDAYSAFWDNMRLNETGLRHELTVRKINDVFFCGLALDYCVAASAIDSARAGFTTFVILDACRGIDHEEMKKRKEELLDNGVSIVNSDIIESYLMHVTGSDCKSNNISDKSFDLNRSKTELATKTSSTIGVDKKLLIDICFKKAIALGS